VNPRIRWQKAGRVLSPVSGFIRQAGFTHSLTPARNCTFGCTYCYVPTMRVQGGLQPEDWTHWGQFTTFKSDLPALLSRQLRPHMVVYCSPLTDPYQPAEADAQIMPAVWQALIARPPRVFALQTRGPLVLRDLPLIQQAAARTRLRISFSVTTDDDAVRRRFEPHCASIAERWDTLRQLCAAGLEAHATLAPLLPCNPERLAETALAVTGRDLIGDPLHVRAVKPRGATTREAALRILNHHQQSEWADPRHQSETAARIASATSRLGFRFATGPEGFAILAQI
jgi:DNA repair photolyase